jgi:hypothetical protein
MPIREAARRLGVSQDTIRRRIRRGDLTAAREPTAQGFVWLVDLPEEEAETGEPAPAGSASDLDHARELNRILLTELEARRREVSELHVLLSQAQRQLTAGPIRGEEAEGGGSHDTAGEEIARPGASTAVVSEAPRRLTWRERIFGRVVAP